MFEDKQGTPSNGEMLKKVLEELDEIKRYSAGTYANVDNEIADIQKTVSELKGVVQDNDRQLDAMEKYQGKLDNIERTLRDIQGKIK